MEGNTATATAEAGANVNTVGTVTGEQNASQSTQTQSQTAQTQTTQTTQTQTPDSYINPDGTFKDGWKEKLVPVDFQGRKCYNAFSDIPGMLKHIGNQDIAISKQGKGIFVPDENATATERELFYKSLGRPDSPKDYKFQVPENLKEYFEQPEMTKAAEALHSLGLSQKQYEGVMALDVQRLAATEKMMAEEDEREEKEMYDEILAKCGSVETLEARASMANALIERFVPAGEYREKMLAVLNLPAVRPYTFDLLATIHQKTMAEGKGPNPVDGVTSGMNLDQQIAEINLQLTENLRRDNRSKYDSLLEQRSRLYSVRFPDNPAKS